MSSSIPSLASSVALSVSFTTNASMMSSGDSLTSSASTPTCLMHGSGMSGLLNSRNLVQDEKLAVATLATLQSGSASTLIKQDLKWIIQSRRRAEGKSEIQVEFKQPVRNELTSEEVVKRARRRELNRLAARRSREKGQRRKDRLVEEIYQLQSQNSELIHVLGSLTNERDSIVEALKQHMKECSEYSATRCAATGLSRHVLEKLGFADGNLSSSQETRNSPSPPSRLYICTSPLQVDEMMSESECHSPPLQRDEITKSHTFSSCPSSPLVVGLSGKPLYFDEKIPTTHIDKTAVMHDISPLDSIPPPLSSSKSVFSSSSIASSGKSYPGSQLSPGGDQRLLPPPPLLLAPSHKIVHTRRNSSHAFESEYPPFSPEGDDSAAHTFTRPASPVNRPSRVLLERSFSFPSSHRETRVDFIPGQSFTSSVDPKGLSSSRESMVRKQGEQEAPLDLVVRHKNDDLQMSSYKDDQNAVRRRSVDDGVYVGHREPLNLSYKCVSSSSYPNLSQDSSPMKRHSTS